MGVGGRGGTVEVGRVGNMCWDRGCVLAVCRLRMGGWNEFLRVGDGFRFSIDLRGWRVVSG